MPSEQSGILTSAALFRQHVYVLFTLLGLSLPYWIWFARDCDDTRDGREGDKHQGEEFCEGYERGGQEVLVVVPPTVGMGILSIVDHDGEGTGIVLKEDAAIAHCTTTRRNRWRCLLTDIRQQCRTQTRRDGPREIVMKFCPSPLIAWRTSWTTDSCSRISRVCQNAP
jgi:hypothetical protein